MGGIAITPLSPASLGAANGRQQGTNDTQGKSVLPRTQLSPQQQAEVRHLQQTDQKVRQHEQAHMAVAGGYARGGASYTYTTGPDGKRYAIGGEVSIDVSPARTPEATVQKMEVVKRAAVAPQDPSAQDRAVYAEAQREETQAQQEVIQERGAQATGAPTAGQATTLQGAAEVTPPAQFGSLLKAFFPNNAVGQNLNIAI